MKDSIAINESAIGHSPSPKAANAQPSAGGGLTVLGIPVRAHWSMAVFAVFVAWNLAWLLLPQFVAESSNGARAIIGLLGAVGLAGSILAHEFGHALRARRHGVETESISLWLLGGVARLKSEAPSPRAGAEIALAGPAVSVGLGVALGAMTLGLVALGLSPLLVVLFGYLAIANLGLAAFNMIPALPLDGGRVLHAWKWHKGGDREVATIDAAVWGNRFGWLLAGFGVVQLLAGGFGFFSVLLGGFLIRAAKAEERRARHLISIRNRRPASSLGEFVGRAFSALLSGRPAATTGPSGPNTFPLINTGARADIGSIIDVDLVRQD